MSRKSEVYTWRVSPTMKAALEEIARREGRSVSQLLDEIVAAKLDASSAEPEEEDRQRRLHDRAADFAGCLSGPDRERAAKARQLVRDRVRGRSSRAR
jgi:hypothetical protein